MADPSVKGYLSFWGEQLGKLKGVAKNAYDKATNPPLISPLTLGVGTTGLATPPSAYPTIYPQSPLSFQDKQPMPQELIDMTNRAAANVGLNPKTLASVVAEESGGTKTPYIAQTGTSGEKGITQIIPEYYFKEAGYKSAEEYGQALMSSNEFAIKETARILKKNYTSKKSVFDALREYNGGPTYYGGESATEYAIRVLKRVGLDDEIPEEYRKTAKSK
ncbi:MAG: transglycosylase SLT domain-containing protein [Candidatus Izemoplasmatales bacterium]